MTLTRATLGKLTQRATKTIEIDGQTVKLQRPTPLEFSQYRLGLVNADGKADVARFPDAILLLTARMWIDDDGARLFSDKETKELGSIDLGFYERLSEACQKFASPEASTALGESGSIPVSGSPVESALSSV